MTQLSARADTAQSVTDVLPDEEARSLPGWIYRDAEFFEVEKRAIFRRSWQIVCHESDIPGAGDYQTLDILGEMVFVLRGEDGAIRAFHNVCRHRASRLLDGAQGNCGGRVNCPYHAWSYDHSGALVGVPRRESFGRFDPVEHALVKVEHEVCLGFIYVRFEPGSPSVRDMLGPYFDELTCYRMEDLRPLGTVRLRVREVNWKNVSDNYSDSLHITVAHPGLTRLFGAGYGVAAGTWVDHMWGGLRDGLSDNWSERRYQALLPTVQHLPPGRRRLWAYYKIWPNIAFDVYPDQIDFMQFIPVSPTQTLLREIAYALPDESREMKAARYLNWRINRRVSVEDKILIEQVQAGMASSSYLSGPLSASEVALRSFARRMRGLIPECRSDRPPPAG